MFQPCAASVMIMAKARKFSTVFEVSPSGNRARPTTTSAIGM
jgi:hypothetical protein